MKISENSLTTNQYTAVKSVHYETKPKYKGDLFNKTSNKHLLKQDKKFHITKKCEVLEQVIEKEVAENSVNNENKPLNLEGLFKKFNNR
jgi:hypothetical protein